MNGASHDAGAPVIGWVDRETPNQRWRLLSVAPGTYKLQNVESSLVLDGGNPAGATQAPDAAAPAQRWHLVPVE